MNHGTKWRVVNTLLMNIPIAATIAVAAQFLAIHTFILPLFCINFAMAYVLSFVVGMCVPAVKWGIGFAMACKAEPNTLKFGLCMNAIVNFVYVLANEIVLSYFNIVVLNHAPMIAVLFGILETFIPIYIVGYIVSFLWNQPCEKITNNIVKE